MTDKYIASANGHGRSNIGIQSPRMVYGRKRTAFRYIIFCFFQSWRKEKDKGLREGGRMRIDSSNIGMESDRAYSLTKGRVSRFTVITGSMQRLSEGALLKNQLSSDQTGQEEEAKETKTPFRALEETLEEMKNRSGVLKEQSIQRVEMEEVQRKVKDIRQQCLEYLMRIFFPERTGSWTQQSETISGTAFEGSVGEASGISLGSSVKMTDMLSQGRTVTMTTYQFSKQYYYEEQENTSFSTTGTVKCADGREISFNLNVGMSRSFQSYYEETISINAAMCDPLVINLDGNIAGLSDQTFFFDIDADGELDEVSELSAGSGYLALDKNGDGQINDGTELFGTASGNGFADLAAYDEDHNGFIDEGDAIFQKLKIWALDENGNKQLYSLTEKGVGAICLQSAATDFDLTGENDQLNGRIRNTGIFLYENGAVGSIQHVDLALHGQKELNMVI